MYCDIVFPKNNEKKFIAVAEKLGIKKLCFVYKLKDFKKHDRYYSGIYVDKVNDIRKARKMADLILCPSERKFFERDEVDVILDVEKSTFSDRMHYRESGLNQVFAKILKGAIAFSFSNLLDKDRIKFMGRIMQNVKIVRKYKTKTIIASFAKDPYHMRPAADLATLFSVLGMHPKEANESILQTQKIIKANQK